MSLLLLSVFGSLSSAARSGWSYTTIDEWGHDYTECDLDSQSPIDIPTDTLSDCADTEILSLDWSYEYTHYVIRNNGHSLQLIPFEIDVGGDLAEIEVLHHTNDINITLLNSFYNTYTSNINRKYCFDSAHFHWGETNDEGSEHTLNGVQYPLEIHLVHYSCDYYELKHAAAAYANGELSQHDDDNILAVIGVLFEVGDANPVLETILNDIVLEGISDHTGLDIIDSDHGSLELFYTEFDLSELVPSDLTYIGYEGSLTTPPCYETVRWHVMRNTMSVSEDQLNRFRLLMEGSNHTIAPNYRPVQELNDRELFVCEQDIENQVVEKEDMSMMLQMSMLNVLLFICSQFLLY